MGEAVVVRGLGKRYRRYRADRPTTLKDALVRGFHLLRSEGSFWALRDVSFSVAPGRMVGVVGRNGAGKSTLLRLIGGVGRPDTGSIDVRGRIGAILDLGDSLTPDLTGRENAFIAGVVSGLTRREMGGRFESMVHFAELEEVIDDPLRTYSTGMQMRLAFAVAVHTDPDILLIDETLAVGDFAFQRKCLERIAQLKADGCAILVVSHDERLIRRTCDEALWLGTGRLEAYGPVTEVVDKYLAAAADADPETRRRTPANGPLVRTSSGVDLRLNDNRFGSQELEIVAVNLLDPARAPVREIDSGDPIRIELEYLAPRPILSPHVTVTIRRDDGQLCYDTDTSLAELTLPTIRGRGRIALDLERLDLIGGQYYVDIGIYEHDWAYAYDYHQHVYGLSVRWTGGDTGIVRPPHRWDLAGLSALNVR
jgi:lipopolysaccharide transport system ATP-binding protein